MVAPLGWLERVPTYKEQQEQLKEKDLNTYGFLGYPLLQTADVALYGADAVPVGQDQVSHLELAREIVRKFNFHFGSPQKPVLVEPHPYLTDVPKILGLDGRKMSKSYGNAVELGEDPESARKRVMVAVTDPARKRRHDPGHPEVCPIYWLHRAYSTPERVELVDRECRSAGIGCVDCKKMLLESLLPALEKHRAARAHQVAHAVAARRGGGRSRRGARAGSARGAGPQAARVSEVQGRRATDRRAPAARSRRVRAPRQGGPAPRRGRSRVPEAARSLRLPPDRVDGPGAQRAEDRDPARSVHRAPLDRRSDLGDHRSAARSRPHHLHLAVRRSGRSRPPSHRSHLPRRAGDGEAEADPRPPARTSRRDLHRADGGAPHLVRGRSVA